MTINFYLTESAASLLIKFMIAQVIIYVLFYLFDKKHREMYLRLFIITLLFTIIVYFSS
ncbi:hypothetical protein SAMN04487837_0192 [Streptococcus equinus]|nr:hypothetical protein SAMN04487837_0192 [Streptococcus equinus]